MFFFPDFCYQLIRCDVTKEDDLTALYDGAEKHFGGSVDIFCNNAGINHTAGWKKCMEIDIVSKDIIAMNGDELLADGSDDRDILGHAEDEQEKWRIRRPDHQHSLSCWNHLC